MVTRAITPATTPMIGSVSIETPRTCTAPARIRLPSASGFAHDEFASMNENNRIRMLAYARRTRMRLWSSRGSPETLRAGSA